MAVKLRCLRDPRYRRLRPIDARDQKNPIVESAQELRCLLQAAPEFDAVLGLHTVHGRLDGRALCLPGRSPLVVGDALGGSSAKLGLYMGLVPTGFILGSYLAGRYASKTSLGAILVFARLLTGAGLLGGLVLSSFGITHVLVFFAPCVFIGIGNGLTMPAANSGALSVRPDLIGTAAGLTAAMRIGGGALIASVAGLFLADSIPALFVMMLISAALALLAALYAAFLDRRQPAD